MPNETEPDDVRRQYTQAHLAHHGEKDLRGAFELYKAIIAAHPGTLEADYSRSQVWNIVNSVVPKQELFDSQVALLKACFARTAKDGG